MIRRREGEAIDASVQPVRIDDDEQRLLEALRQELRLDAFRVGFHDDRDDRGWKEDGVRMVRGWAAVIAPSFDPWAAVAVIDTGAGRRFGAISILRVSARRSVAKL